MKCLCLSYHKSWFLILFMILIFMVGRIQGVCIEEERKALLEIKASLHDSFHLSAVDSFLSTWVDHGGSAGGECCDWERIKCDTTTGHVTDLSLRYMISKISRDNKIWPINVFLFLSFKELRSLDLSWNNIDNTVVSSTGFERLSSLKKLEMLNLSHNYIENGIFPSLGALTSLKILDLSSNKLKGYFPAHEFAALENLEVLDLSRSSYNGTFHMQGYGRPSILKKLKILNLGYNNYNESVLASLGALSSLKELSLKGNSLLEPFPSQEFAHLTKLEKLDLSSNYALDGTLSIRGCKSLLRLKRLETITIADNNFDNSIISCLSFLPSLKSLDLSRCDISAPIQELSSLRNLETLDLSDCELGSFTVNGTLSNLVHLNLNDNSFMNDVMRSMDAFPSLRFLSLESSTSIATEGHPLELPNLPKLEFLLLSNNHFNGTLPMEALASFKHLRVLDLSGNAFVGSIPSTIESLSSLRVLSIRGNSLNGSLPNDALCNLKNLHTLDLSGNMIEGNLPECFNLLSSLKFFDISLNQFTGILRPSLFANHTSLEYVDLSHNKFEGSFSFSSFSNHTKLEAVAIISNNENFEVQTEEPIGWIPMFQLKILVLSNCNVNRGKGSVSPSFLLHQHELRLLDMSHNSLNGPFPNWLIKNNTMLEVVNLRNNSFGSVIHMPLYSNAMLRWLDASENHIIGEIPQDIQTFLPYIAYLNLSRNALSGAIPSSVGNMSELDELDLSGNELSGEVPHGFFTNLSQLGILMLSNNSLHGEVLSGNLSLGNLVRLHLDRNRFTGKIGNTTIGSLDFLDISNNLFTGVIPSWVSNANGLFSLLMRNNRLEGQFPCGTSLFSFLDISQNSLSGPIPSCLNFQETRHLHLSSNRFIGSIPNSFRNLTGVLTLDIANNSLSGKIPKFIGELPDLRILLMGKNKFSGSIPKKLCQLNHASLIDLSSNFLSGSIPNCLQNITGPSDPAFLQEYLYSHFEDSSLGYGSSILIRFYRSIGMLDTQDEVQFTIKSMSRAYKGNILNYMSGLDLSCNKLTGDIPPELGMLTQILALNLSHNQLSGPIPTSLSNLRKIESLDLSSNHLNNHVPPELIKLNSLAIFNVSYNNLSGRLPEMKAQFGTFTKESYEGNSLLCGLPLEKKCTATPHVTTISTTEEDIDEKWFAINIISFYGSCGSTWFVFMLGFVAVLYTNPYWRRRWLELVEEY